MPVRSKDRLKVVMTSAAAMLIVAANAPVWAQTANPALRTAVSQGLNGQQQGLGGQQDEADQQPSNEPPDEAVLGAGELRGVDAPALEGAQPAGNEPSAQAQVPQTANPIESEEPQYGLPPPISATSNYINYGAKKKKKPKFYQVRKIQPPGLQPLPPLTSYKSAPETLPRGSNPPLQDPDNPGPTVAVIPLLPRPLRPKPDATPFAPLGLDVGSLRLLPYVETDTGYDSNPNFLSNDVVGSPYVHGEVGLTAKSLWSQHSFTADLRGGYYDYFRVSEADRPDATGTLTGRIDVLRDTQINLVSTFDIETQQPGSPILAIPNSVFITNRPLFVTYGQSAGVTQQFNRLSVSLKGAFARYSFGDATQSNGTILALSQEDYNDYGVEGRLSYEVTPALVPYIDVLGDRRGYDHFIDVYGFERSSNGVAGKLGATLEFTRLLTGDIAVGYANRVYVDPRLPNLSAPTIDASLVYAITPLTTATLTASTFLSETTLAYASGTVSRSVSLNLSHALRPDLLLSGTFAYANNVYDGAPITEQIYSGTLKADYSLSRFVVITGSFTHQRFLSTALDSNYTDDIFLLGLRLQD
ncbi:MAG: outer membrane beta-barrel protein [Methylovirgula sp.]